MSNGLRYQFIAAKTPLKRRLIAFGVEMAFKESEVC